ncbi:MAG: CCA tRNA nucleotidyltransferase, partial [Nitrospirae bacterium]|nr:CCA tRNA nucleotidyltransferase [Nitrospirota bacterium]
RLLDFFGGRRDLKERTIRVLHDLSFVEDPTRVFRAIRFEQRFDFKISRHTKRLIETAVAMDLFHRLSGPRLFGELWLIFEEADPAKTVERLGDLDLLRFIHPRLDVSAEKLRHLARVKEALAWYALLFQEPPVRGAPMVYMTALLDQLEEADVLEVAARLSISPTDRGILLLPRRTAPSVLRTLSRRPPPAPSAVYEALSPIPIEGILYLLAGARPKSAQKAISEFITHGRFVRPPISGDDLTTMGIAPGPIYRRIMAELRAAALDGKPKGREEAIGEWVNG